MDPQTAHSPVRGPDDLLEACRGDFAAQRGRGRGELLVTEEVAAELVLKGRFFESSEKGTSTKSKENRHELNKIQIKIIMI